jgi:VanZ family protein
MHKTSASPLAVAYVALIVYASLYPFSGWRDQGLFPWDFLLAPWPRYWTGFDVAINLAGYVPLGALAALSALRARRRHVAMVALLVGVLLSFTMEALQSYLPTRVASREDLLLNSLGTALGALATLLLDRWGVIRRWSRLRARWFVEQSRGGMVLLAAWPVALMFPAAVPFGLGQIQFRVEEVLTQQLAGTSVATWLPQRTSPLTPLGEGAEMVCVFLGLLIPCLLGFCVVRSMRRRLWLVGVMTLLGVAATALSAALSWGPAHAWAWLGMPAILGVGLCVVIALALTLVSWRSSSALLLLALGVYLSLLNQAPESPYFAQTLQAWEQGRFIRFHGLAQWLGWLWPYATLCFVLLQLGRSDTKTRIDT